MGLSLEVGMLIDLRAADEEGFEHFVRQFDAVNRALEAAGLSAHHEPVEAKDDLPWSCSMWGYSGIHHLRRIAAHLWAGQSLPPPGEGDPTKDPICEQYYAADGARPQPFLGKLFGRKAASAASTRFDHLMFHSDAEGFYLPRDFAEVIFPAEELEIAGGMIGSTPRLLAECRVLAKALGIPEELDAESDEVTSAAESQGQGEGWRQYGIEVHTCLQLLEACRRSIRSGSAIVFT